MAPLHAGVIAALALLFPWSDSIRLWSTASLNSVAVCFFLVGLILALRGLERRGWMSLAMHSAAVALYILSVLTYQVAAAAALLAGVFYLGRIPPRRVIARWLADAAGVLGALIYSLVATAPVRHVASFSERVRDVPEFLRQALSLLASALVPLGTPSRLVKELALLLVGTVVVLAVIRVHRSTNHRLAYWLRVIAVAVVGIGAAYVMQLREGPPLGSGIGNRANVFASLPYCALVYGLLVIGAKLLAGDRRITAALALAGVLAVGITYGVRVRDDESLWTRASRLQHGLLATFDSELPHLPRQSTVLTFGYPAEVAPGVLIFARSWDLLGAVQLEAKDDTLAAYPVYRGVEVLCRENHVAVNMGGFAKLSLSYGRLFFLDVPTGRHERIRTRVSCGPALRTFRAGPDLG